MELMLLNIINHIQIIENIDVEGNDTELLVRLTIEIFINMVINAFYLCMCARDGTVITHSSIIGAHVRSKS